VGALPYGSNVQLIKWASGPVSAACYPSSRWSWSMFIVIPQISTAVSSASGSDSPFSIRNGLILLSARLSQMLSMLMPGTVLACKPTSSR
jgi:hypothetical protein